MLFSKWFDPGTPWRCLWGPHWFMSHTLEPPGKRLSIPPPSHSKAEMLNNTEFYSFPTYQCDQCNLGREFYSLRETRKLVSAKLRLTPSSRKLSPLAWVPPYQVCSFGKRKETLTVNCFLCKPIKWRLHNFSNHIPWTATWYSLVTRELENQVLMKQAYGLPMRLSGEESAY